jgi:hypothetical protein
VPAFSVCPPSRRSVPCSFDLSSSDVRKVADVTVGQAKPWTVC